MSEGTCPWKELVLSGQHVNTDIEAEQLKRLQETAAKYGADIDSLDLVDAGMTFESSGKARDKVAEAAGACACDGSGCLVIQAVEDVLQDPDSYPDGD